MIFVNNIWGNILLASVWAWQLRASLATSFFMVNTKKTETSIYVLMGWLCMFLGKVLYTNLSLSGFWLLVAGGVIFTLGAVIYSFPRIPGLHLIWHFFVMAGTLTMFLSIYMNI
ncbi:PAQR family membrane homeostasis protein TrhA [Lentilactobacillus kisonensis]|uniref:PAQR family membrane homeostasis protein TrhA n=1 Tax=Lentilactobacillus kisonensis TaxID=481722 RepID=UPI001FB4A285|nr:hemolysin III family protein [Lentilactobacillus kisonensis]